MDESLSRVPGGGITGVLPPSGVGARICGSTSEGGHRTPPDCARRSVSCGPAPCPVVVPFGAIVLSSGTASVGEQLFFGRAMFSGAVLWPGVDGDGGACANASVDPAITHTAVRSEKRRIQEKRARRAGVPSHKATDWNFRLIALSSREPAPTSLKTLNACDSGSTKNAPSGPSAGARPV